MKKTKIIAALIILVLVSAIYALPSRWEGDAYFNGNLSSKTMTIPDNTVVNADVSSGADIAAIKLEHQYSKFIAQASDINTVDEQRCIHAVYGSSGSVVAFEAGSVTVCAGDSTITVDLHKNGASILTSVITLDSSNAAYTVEAGTIDTATLADGDVLEVIIDVTAGTGNLADGVFASCIIREDAQ